jgi:hypothetical protein
MKAILVFIDGTICDTRQRHHLIGTLDFHRHDELLKDLPVPGSVPCLRALAQRYEIVYIGARPDYTLPATEEWLQAAGFPVGAIYLAETQTDRLTRVRGASKEFDFIAGIGDRWDDNQLHAEIGCLSIILQEFEGAWDTVTQRILKHHRQQKIKENEIHLRGKVEGLARVCPLLQSKFGENLWQAYFEAVLEMAEQSRPLRAKEDLESFANYGLDPNDLRDAAKWDELLWQEDWENNPAYGLQDFELVEASKDRYVHKVARCLYADLWKAHALAELGYQVHCHTDVAWWDRPAWNPKVRFEQPKTLMQGDDHCLFIQYLPDDE